MDCGACTLCCELLEIKSMDSAAGLLCSACKNNGCSIHDTLPDECKGFKCAYYQQEKSFIGFRPDKCHVIFERISDTLFLGTQDPDYPLGKDVLAQINYFIKDGFTVIINNKNHSAVYGSGRRSLQEVYAEYKSIVEARHGSCNV